MKRVLVACEFSGVVRRAFEERGFDAWSCDLEPSLDGGNHIQGDVVQVLNDGWDLIIAHPPCAYLTSSAEWAYKDGPYHQRVSPTTLVGEARREARQKAIEFVLRIASADCPQIAIENPVGALSSAWRRPDQIIQPHQFGADASKATCLWLKNLKPLTPTVQCPPRIVNGKKRWANQTDSGQNRLSPSERRWADRSVTYPGIAEAMATQWGETTF